MSKKKHPEHVNHERWLVSYADFITLLFAFFVVLFASGQTDKRKEVKLAQSMQTAFSHFGIFDPHSKTPPISPDDTAAVNAIAAPITLPIPASAEPRQPAQLAQEMKKSLPGSTPRDPKQAAERLREAVNQQVAERHLASGAITIRQTQDGVVISLREAGFFTSGSADVHQETVQALESVAAALPHQSMRVEGHTDNVPIHTAQYNTNWELSTARAASVTRLLVSAGDADPTQIAAAGYAEFRPIASNETEEGRAANRRVDIVLLNPSPVQPTVLTGVVPSKPGFVPIRQAKNVTGKR